jgi:GxxExxY protein
MHKPLIENLVRKVYTTLGFGMAELSFEKCLAAELMEHFKDVNTEYHIQQYYTTELGRKIQIADLRIDILINEEIIIELKTLENSLSKKKDITNTKEYKQTQRYMKLTNIHQGFLINFYNGGYDIFEVKL